MLDVAISAALATFTIVMAYLGVHVTLHPKNESPREQFWYKVGFSVCGILAVFLVIVQGVRSTRAQQRATNQIVDLQADIRDAKAEAQSAKQEVKSESSRRQQAERDLFLALQATSSATRQGVAEDIRKAPFKVEVKGESTNDPAEKKRRLEIRSKLAELLEESYDIKNICLGKRPQPQNFSCKDATDNWGSVRDFV